MQACCKGGYAGCTTTAAGKNQKGKNEKVEHAHCFGDQYTLKAEDTTQLSYRISKPHRGNNILARPERLWVLNIEGHI
jgi:hypothetical protein